jgi:hypothetical protein
MLEKNISNTNTNKIDNIQGVLFARKITEKRYEYERNQEIGIGRFTGDIEA